VKAQYIVGSEIGFTLEVNDFKVAPYLTDALVLLRLRMFEPLHHPCSPTLVGVTRQKWRNLADSRQYRRTDFIGKFWIILKDDTERTSLRVKNETHIPPSCSRTQLNHTLKMDGLLRCLCDAAEMSF
jgi:hypothetical protein